MHRLEVVPFLALISIAACVASAEGPALHPHESMNNWGTWGPDDERGAVNYITPERIVAASKLIQSGKMFSLAIPIAAGVFAFAGILRSGSK